MEQLGSLLSLKGCSQDAGQAVFSSRDSTGKESASQLSQHVGRIHFLVAAFLLLASFGSACI